jgi:photosystem II stability/assembly factor-like uncharacterized protein
VEPGSGDLLLTTNRGFFRIRDGQAKRIEGTVETEDGVSPVGSFLAFRALGEGRLVGSGHPDRKEKLAEFLGFIRSDDGGRTWLASSRYGIGDLHVIRIAHGRIYAVDAVLGGVVVSEDDGQDWLEWPTPPGDVLDLVVDPEDPDYLLISNERELFRSEDAGQTWRSLGSAPSARLAWPAPGRLYRADENGRVYRSEDRGESWGAGGSIDGEPWKLESDGDRLLAALSDATIVRSDDGGESWTPVFEP